MQARDKWQGKVITSSALNLLHMGEKMSIQKSAVYEQSKNLPPDSMQLARSLTICRSYLEVSKSREAVQHGFFKGLVRYKLLHLNNKHNISLQNNNNKKNTQLALVHFALMVEQSHLPVVADFLMVCFDRLRAMFH